MVESKGSKPRTGDYGNVVRLESEYLRLRDVFLRDKSLTNFLSLLHIAIGAPGFANEVTDLWDCNWKSIPWTPSGTNEWATFLSRYLIVPFEHDTSRSSLITASGEATAAICKDEAAVPSSKPLQLSGMVTTLVDLAIKNHSLRQASRYGDFFEAERYDDLLTEIFGERNPALVISQYMKGMFPPRPWEAPGDLGHDEIVEFRLDEFRELYSAISVWTGCAVPEGVWTEENSLSLEVKSNMKTGVGLVGLVGFTHLAGSARKRDLFCERTLRAFLQFMPQPLLVSLIRSHLKFGEKPYKITGLVRLLRLGLGASSVPHGRDRSFVPWSLFDEIIDSEKYWPILAHHMTSSQRSKGYRLCREIATRLVSAYELHVRTVSFGVSPLPHASIDAFEYVTTLNYDLDEPALFAFKDCYSGTEYLWVGYLDHGLEQLDCLFEAAKSEGHPELATAFVAYYLFGQAFRFEGCVGDWKILGPIVDQALDMHGADRVRTACWFASVAAEKFGLSLQAMDLRARIGPEDIPQTLDSVMAESELDNRKKSRDEIQRRLVEDLGEGRWLRLDNKAKQFLLDAEIHWSRNADELGKLTFSDWGPLVTAYVRAIETYLVSKIDAIWNSPSMDQYFQRRGVRRDKPTLGPILHIFLKFSELPIDLQHLFEKERIALQMDRDLISQLLDITRARNRAAHSGEVSETDAIELRKQLFKKRILARLIDSFA